MEFPTRLVLSTSSYAKLSVSPNANCLKPGDEIILLHAFGSGANIGNYEFLHVGGVVGDTVYFTTQKTKYYGANAGDDTNIGTSQTAIIQRVPNYQNVIVNGTLSTNNRLVFRVAGTLSGATGSIIANGKGSGGYGTGGQGASNKNGGGGGYGTNGVAVSGTGGGAAGISHGDPSLINLFSGSNGGRSGQYVLGDGSIESSGAAGGVGGGIIMILGNTISYTGIISSNGGNGAYTDGFLYGGGGSGGSVRIEGNTISIGNITIGGGVGMANGNGAGGKGRIAIYYYNSLSGGPSANDYTYLQYVDPNATPSPTPTGAAPTATPTLTPPPVGWQVYDYDYSATIPHAVTSVVRPMVTDTYQYDANGNMTCRVEKSITYLQTYNLENRVASIAKLASGNCATPGNYASKWDFGYDGDGTRTSTLYTPYVSGAPQTAVLTAYYFGGAYEVTGSSVKKYYSFGGQTIMRDANGLQYFLTDHLGSTVAITDISGTLTSQQRYLPFGQVRSDVGTITQTDLGYTGQRQLDEDMGGLMDYKARFYSPYINHFLQPDSLIPNPSNPQAWNTVFVCGE